MKTLVKTFALIFVLCFATAASASTDPEDKPGVKAPAGETAIKLLPGKKGSIKVLYVNNAEQNVTVRIHANVNFTDKIKLNAGSKGFIKSYNLKELETGIFWIEIEDSQLSLSYEVEKREDGTIFAKYWKQFESAPVSPAVASTAY